MVVGNVRVGMDVTVGINGTISVDVTVVALSGEEEKNWGDAEAVATSAAALRKVAVFMFVRV